MLAMIALLIVRQPFIAEDPYDQDTIVLRREIDAWPGPGGRSSGHEATRPAPGQATDRSRASTSMR
jgi:hypothetical protein